MNGRGVKINNNKKNYEDDFNQLKVKGEMESYLDTNENQNNKINLKLLIKVQSCVRRFLQTSKFLKENRNNHSVIFLYYNIPYGIYT